MNLDYLPHCKEKELCKHPLCHCYDYDKPIREDLSKTEVGDIVVSLANGITILNELLRRSHYYSREQRRIYRERKNRYIKNKKFWIEKYRAMK